jgi:hypothetical protein
MAAEDWVDAENAPGTSWWDTAGNVAQTADDAVRAAANAVTFGMADRLAGYAGGEGTAAEVAKSEAARQRSPYASIAGDVAGSAALPGFGAEALAARYGGRLGARALGYGVTGAGVGAAQGAGTTYTGNLPDYVQNALIGGALGGTLGAAGGAILGRRPATSRAETPIANELHDVSQHNYDVLAQSRAPYEPAAFAQRADDLENQLLAERYHWRDSPATWRALNEMRGEGVPGQLNTGPGAIIDPASIEFVRKGINKIPQTPERATDRASGEVVKRGLDDFIINPPPGAVLPGGEREAAAAAQRALEARGNWAAYKRVQALDDLIHNAQNTAGATASGLNLQAELRKGVRSFVRRKEGESPASLAGYNEPEIAALTGYTRPGGLTNVTRYASNFLGGGGGLGTQIAMATGGVGGGIAGHYFKDDPELGAAIGLAAPAVGLGLRVLGNRRATAELQQLQNMIAQRSPLYQYRTTFAGMQPGPGAPRTAAATRNALTLELMKQRGINIHPVSDGESDWQ